MDIIHGIRFKKFLEETKKEKKELEESYKQNLIKSGKCDTLIGIIYKGNK